MGRNKADLRIGETTMLDRISRELSALELVFSVVQEDVVAPCGPIGGVITAFERFQDPVILFVSCDMPFVSSELLGRVMETASRAGSVFLRHDGRFGFPFTVARGDLEVVRRRHVAGEFSLQGLARDIGASWLESLSPERELFNVNTPADLERARGMA